MGRGIRRHVRGDRLDHWQGVRMTYYENAYSSATYTGGMLLPCECCGSRAAVCRCHRVPRACPGCDAYDADRLPEPGPQGDSS